MPRKGLARKGVCLLQHYCPFCFKGKIGVSCGLYVAPDNTLINKVQVLHASEGNGLSPIDLQTPGDLCENTDLCKMICLVCGKPTLDGTDDEFQLFLDFFCRESEECPLALRYEINDALEELDLVLTKQWDMPIHKGCSKKTRCKCVVPLGTTICPTHHCSLVEASKVTPVKPVKQQAAVEQRPAAIIKTTPSVVHLLEKADWLPPATMSTRAVNYANPYADGGHKRYGKPSQPVPLVKPTLKSIQLEAAAAQCAFKIDQWTGHHPTNAKLSLGKLEPGAGGAKKKPYSLKEHNDKFDPAIHGPCQVNGVLGYRLVNMEFVPTTSDVNILNEDGTLTPI